MLKSSPLPPSSESSTSLSALNITKESKPSKTETNDCKHEAAKPLESNEEVIRFDDLPLVDELDDNTSLEPSIQDMSRLNDLPLTDEPVEKDEALGVPVKISLKKAGKEMTR